MKFGHIIRAAVIVVAAFLLVASASASTISYTTSVISPYTTGFTTGSPLVLSNASGTTATLTFTGTTATVGTPTNINLGDFLLVCSSCSTEAANTASATFGGFTFDLYLFDSTDNAYGLFTGSSVGGTVWSDSSGISISWSPSQLGPGALNVSGSTGTVYFDISTPTLIVAPNSGAGGGSSNGDTTVQAQALGGTSVPEPATMAMVGGLFIGLAALARKRRA
jgi:hypothetical protein